MLIKIIERSLKITWKNPILWIFGFLVSYITTNEIILILNVPWQITQGSEPSSFIFQLVSSLKLLLKTPEIATANFLKVVLSLLVFWVIPFLLAVWAEIVLFLNAKRKLKKESFSLKNTSKKFLLVLGVNFLLVLINSGFIELINQSFQSFTGFRFWGLVIFLLFVELLIFILVKFVLCSIILEELNLFSAIKRGILFFRKFWQKIISLLILLFLLNLAFGIIINLIAVGGFSPFFILSNLLSKWGICGDQTLFYAGLALTGCLVFVLWTFFFAFQNIIWPIFFLSYPKIIKTQKFN